MANIETSDQITVYLGLGSNSGDRGLNLSKAILALKKEVEIVAVSSLYETAHIGPTAPDHLNCVVKIETMLSSHKLLEHTQKIEADLGRNRATERRWGERLIDIDILIYGDFVICEPTLKVPHPELTHRRFVIEPLCQLEPTLIVPGQRVSISARLESPEIQEQRVVAIK